MADNSTIFDDQLHWYKDAIIYELHIKAFSDGNGDGIGDFEGLLTKLDYLQEMGITAIWLLPFYPSPLKDDGYDIADYYSIHPNYGNTEQFKQILEEAHNRNLKVITELVINHTSDQHPWFQRARTAPKDSPERAFYVWTDDPNKYKDVRIIFQDFEASNWTWDPVAQQYFWHRFFHHQPDLNYDNPLVQQEIFEIIDYWCAMGVDGFRLDAVPYLYEREGTNGENLPETHAFLKKLRAHIDQYFPGTVFLAEANMWPEDSASYFGDGDECHMNYHFPVMPRMFMSLQMEDRYPITDIFDQTPKIPDTCQWAIFLRNHDELTLEMVTDEERDYMYRVYAKDPKAKINLGIRHRLAPLMENNRRKIELMNSLLFSLPGTPVIYYGDEIGMGDNVYLGDRDGVRTPMQWSPDRNAGFSNANPQSLYLPVIIDPEYSYESVNVETQRRNTSSLFWFMKHIINMRKKYIAFGRGDMVFIHTENPKVLVFTRTYNEEILLIVVNLSKFSQPAEVDLSAYKGYVPVEVFSKNKFPLIKEATPYFFTLGPHSYQWFALEKIHEEVTQDELPQLSVSSWNDLLADGVSEQLANDILPQYLPKTKWFTGRSQPIYDITILNYATINWHDKPVFNLLLEVGYASALPELYQLPIVFVKEEVAKNLSTNCPQSIIAQIKIDGESGLLCDALYTNEFQQWLMENMAAKARAKVGDGTIVFNANNLLQLPQDGEEIKPRLHAEYESSTAISYNNRYFLKIYRKLARAANPDVEIVKYLSDQMQFEHVPAFVGTISWNLGSDSMVLGTMQLLVQNHGNGKTYMLERINNYIERILARDRSTLNANERIGTFHDPVTFEELPEELKILLGGRTAEQAHLIGIRTGELHQAMAAASNIPDFKPEDFSLHYQRSLFSSMQSLVRECYQAISKNSNSVPDSIKKELINIAGKREEVLNILRRIYAKKLDVIKTRIHGNYSLGRVLLTGKDVSITDFSGNPFRSYSERRLKRSPLRDVATMIRSFYYTAYKGFFTTSQVPKEEINSLLPFASQWAYYISEFFCKGYFDTVQGSAFIPLHKKDLKIMLDTYLMERILTDLKNELNNHSERVIIPLQMLQRIIEQQEELSVVGSQPEV